MVLGLAVWTGAAGGPSLTPGDGVAGAPAVVAPTPVAVAAGEYHTCALTSAGGVKCWGANFTGSLGDGSMASSPAPVDVTNLSSGVQAVSAGHGHTCALTDAGEVKCWGLNSGGQIGDGTTTTRRAPVAVPGLASVTAVAVGGWSSCALTAAGGVKCWGANNHGQLGDGTTTSRSSPVDVAGLGAGVAAVDVGDGHACALMAAGGVKCWGENGHGELGDGTTADRLTPVDVSGLGSGMAAIAAGGDHSCAVSALGALTCWGANNYGALGDGTNTTRTTPVAVSGLAAGVMTVDAGNNHTCAVTTGGAMKCWGTSGYGELGDGTTTGRSTPVAVSGLGSGVASISVGGVHTCAITQTGTLKCWGLNESAQIGDGTHSFSSGRTTPATVYGFVSGLSGITSNAIHTCALTSTGGAVCWGSDWYAELGDGGNVNSSLPIPVSGLNEPLAALAAGSFHTCGLTASGGVMCWGINAEGELGDGGPANYGSLPVAVVGLGSGVVMIAAGGEHTCALTVAGAVKCWGGNSFGELGDGTTTYRETPVDVVGLPGGIAQIDAGSDHTCARTGAGTVWCWGGNSGGQLGDGTKVDRSTPVQVTGLGGGAATIAAGLWETCAATLAGGAKCWGRNTGGQLGDGTTTDRTSPVDVVGLAEGIASIAVGEQHACALTGGGAVKCWGRNSAGEVGDGTTVQRLTPVTVTGLSSGAAAISAGSIHTCAVTTSGRGLCWGDNAWGEVGDGARILWLTPVDVVGFGPVSKTLAVGRGGGGAGSVGSDPAGIACGATCTAGFAYGSPVTLHAAPQPGSTFAGWSGACSGVGDCVLTLGADKAVHATFVQAPKTLSVSTGGNGSGRIASSPAGIACTASCTESFAHGEHVLLTAIPSTGSSFGGWSGACSGTAPCTLTMDADRSATATFTLVAETLAVALAGTGGGDVTSTPAGIACGAACTSQFTYGAFVTLQAAARPGSTFTGWSGACSGAGACTVTMDGARSVTATFAANPKTLTVSRAGNGVGSVTSSPAAVACGSTCSAAFAHGTPVVLAAVAAPGSTFTGWSGACSGTRGCTLTMDADRAATATFTVRPTSAPALPRGTVSGKVIMNGARMRSGAVRYGSRFDVTHGSLTLKTRVGTIRVWGGGSPAVFVLSRGAGKENMLDVLALAQGDFAVCGRAGQKRARSASQSGVAAHAVRGLSGRAEGGFRVKAKRSATTVRAATWTVTDRCDGTLTKVATGKAEVYDLGRKTSIVVAAGRSYMAPRR